MRSKIPNVQIKPGYRVRIRVEARIGSDPTFIENSEYFVYLDFSATILIFFLKNIALKYHVS